MNIYIWGDSNKGRAEIISAVATRVPHSRVITTHTYSLDQIAADMNGLIMLHHSPIDANDGVLAWADNALSQSGGDLRAVLYSGSLPNTENTEKLLAALTTTAQASLKALMIPERPDPWLQVELFWSMVTAARRVRRDDWWTIPQPVTDLRDDFNRLLKSDIFSQDSKITAMCALRASYELPEVDMSERTDQALEERTKARKQKMQRLAGITHA